MTRTALDVLARADRALSDRHGPLRSLGPGRARATALAELGEHFFAGGVDAGVARSFAEALESVAEAQSKSFPGNLFWDFDFLSAALFALVAPPSAAGSRGRLAEASRKLVELNALFSSESPVQFQYAHDFIYGFDWAKWVERDPEARSHVAPFGPEFLDYSLERGHELIELIGNDDPEYPRLPPGAARNPFPFSREPQAEERLHRDLAERGLIPVESWRADARPRADRPFRALRRERAKALGL